MNPFRLAITIFSLLAVMGLPARAAERSTVQPPYRFLILVDSSSSMRRLDNVTATAVYDLIYDGILGRMEDGDVYAVWTFSETVDTDFYPPLVWSKHNSRAQAQSVDAQLRKLKYQGKPHLEEAIRMVNPIVRRSDDLTVIIVHDGSGVMFGTPFDLPITTLYRQFQKDMLKSERPFLTSFAVRDKQMTAWSVDAAGGTIGVPVFPRKPLVTQTAPTNTVKKVIAAKPSEPDKKPEPKKAPPASIIVKGPIKPPNAATNTPTAATPPLKPTPKVVEAPKPELTTKSATAAEAPKPMPKPQLTTTIPVEPKPFQPVMEAAKPTVLPAPASPAQNSSIPIPSPAPKAALAEPTLQLTPPPTGDPVHPSDITPLKLAAQTETAPAQSVIQPKTAHAKEAPTASAPPAPVAVVTAKAVDSAAQLAQTAVVTPPAAGPDWMKIVFGIICLGGAIGLVLLIGRKNRPAMHGSVISRSMDNDRK